MSSNEWTFICKHAPYMFYRKDQTPFICSGMYTILTILHKAYKHNDNESSTAIYNESMCLHGKIF